jgi:hypothetical protein
VEVPVLLGQLVCDGEFDLHHPWLDRGELRSEQCHEPLPREADAYTGFELGIVRDTVRGGRHNGPHYRAADRLRGGPDAPGGAGGHVARDGPLGS